MATKVGEIYYDVDLDTKNFSKSATEVDGKAQSLATRMSGTFSKVAKVGLAAVAAAAIAAGAAIAKNLGNAIDRVDTLANFPRVLQALGISSEQATKATERLSESLLGLPTALNTGAKSVQQLVATGMTVDEATDAFLAFNNAMLASGTDAATAESSFVQLNQALSRGKIEGQEWNSIVGNMPSAFAALQNESGKTREELRELYATNPQQLVKDLIRLNKEGGGGLASLEKQARDATGGIRTSMANVSNAISRGMENIVRSIGGGSLEAGQKKISDFISRIGTTFNIALTQVGVFITWLGRKWEELKPTIMPIINVVGVLLTDAVNTVKQAFADAWVIISPYKEELKTLAMVTAGVLGLALLGLIVVIAHLASWFIKIVAYIASFIGWIIQASHRVGEFAGTVAYRISEVINWFVQLPGRIMSAIGNLSNLLTNAGRSLIDGLLRGINEKFNQVKQTLSKLTDKLPDWKGPMSLDKSILKKSGQAVISGFVSGLESQYGAVESSLDRLTGNLQVGGPSVATGVMSGLADGDRSSASPGKTINVTNNNYSVYDQQKALSDIGWELR